MALSPAPDPFTTAMSLVHELQHSKLGALLDLIELYDPGDRRRFYSPWRPDPRPIGGLLQAAYAFLAVTRFWGRYATGRTGPGPPPLVSSQVAEYEFARGRAQVRTTLRTLTGSGALTEPGTRFVGGSAGGGRRTSRAPRCRRRRTGWPGCYATTTGSSGGCATCG